MNSFIKAEFGDRVRVQAVKGPLAGLQKLFGASHSGSSVDGMIKALQEEEMSSKFRIK